MSERQRERVGSEERGYQKEQDRGQFQEDMLDWPIRLGQS